MEKIEAIIRDFIRDDVQNNSVVVANGDGAILYADEKLVLSDTLKKQIEKRGARLTDGKGPRSWEFSDMETQRYYRIESARKESDGETFICHLLTDVSDYASLYQDISDYSRKIEDISDFQADILSRMSEPYEACLPSLKAFCRCEEATLYLDSLDGEGIRRISYDTEFVTRLLPSSERTDRLLSADRFDLVGGCHCLLRDEADHRRYAVFLKNGEDFDSEHFHDISLYNVIRLFIENGILREKIIYESEHDHLTGLYNKGKYLTLLADGFSRPDSIAIYNLDVNDLKYMNDNFGHEAGDHLIKKAAESIHAVSGENVLGFRMGGDEFAMVALDVSEKEAEEIHSKWEETLAALNEIDDGIECVIACGMAFGSGSYDPEGLMEQADVLMYRNKRRMKEERIKRMRKMR